MTLRNGLCKIAPHRKDYSLLRTFGDVLPDPGGLPAHFSIYDGRPIPNQGTWDDRFTPALRPLPVGCTAEMCTYNAGLEDDALYNPVDFYFAIPPGTDGEGRDMRVALNTAATRGFLLPTGGIGAKRAPYLNCYGSGQIDDFTAVKIALWLNQHYKVGVSAGMWWYYEFFNTKDGSLPLPSFDTSRATLHAVLITGWRTLPDGTEELEIISWQGMDYGLKGLAYMPRATYNAIMQQPWTGAFVQAPLNGRDPITVGIQAYIDHFVYWFRNAFNV